MKVLMVCLGNICRSPIAEGILRQRVKELGLDVETDSAGTAAFHVGEAPDTRMIKVAKANGIDISDLRARQFLKVDFKHFDLIYAMDKSNYDNILNLAEKDTDREKVRMILNETSPGSQAEVPDPYYGGEEGFQHVIDLLDEAMDHVMNRINEER